MHPCTRESRLMFDSFVVVKAGLTFPVARIKRYLKKGHYANRIGSGERITLQPTVDM